MSAFAPGASWRQYYAFLTLPGMALGLWFVFRFHPQNHGRQNETNPSSTPDDPPRWASFFLLTVLGMFSGFLYAAFLTFLPRYLDSAGLDVFTGPGSDAANRNFLTGCVLIVGMLSQYTSGRIARPGKLEPLLASIMAGSAPFLAAMAFAEGTNRVWVTGGFAWSIS